VNLSECACVANGGISLGLHQVHHVGYANVLLEKGQHGETIQQSVQTNKFAGLFRLLLLLWMGRDSVISPNLSLSGAEVKRIRVW
jgi:hypothetical protein